MKSLSVVLVMLILSSCFNNSPRMQIKKVPVNQMVNMETGYKQATSNSKDVFAWANTTYPKVPSVKILTMFPNGKTSPRNIQGLIDLDKALSCVVVLEKGLKLEDVRNLEKCMARLVSKYGPIDVYTTSSVDYTRIVRYSKK